MCTWGPNSMKGWLLIMGAIMTHHQPCNREGPLVHKLGQPETTGTMQMSLVPTHNHYNSAWRDKNWPLSLPPELGSPLLPFLFSGSWEGRRQSYFFLLSHLVSLRRKKTCSYSTPGTKASMYWAPAGYEILGRYFTHMIPFSPSPNPVREALLLPSCEWVWSMTQGTNSGLGCRFHRCNLCP